VEARKENKKKTQEPQRKPATTEDVLGPAGTDYNIPAKWQRHYERLEQLRERLLQKKGELAEDAREEAPTYSMHMADAGTDTYDRDWALSMLSSEQNAVYQIEQAMDRIHNGSYGKCEVTGKPIERERLEAIPWTRFSAEAVRELERNGTAKKTKLGTLGSFAGVSRSAERESSGEGEG
jgi:RNA polymerase-binding transcription factor DksA